MESTRSGLLSTLIMTVPLIVVPAIALLRPSLPGSGVSDTPLEASADNEFLDDLDAIAGGSFENSSGDARNPTGDGRPDDFEEWFSPSGQSTGRSDAIRQENRPPDLTDPRNGDVFDMFAVESPPHSAATIATESSAEPREQSFGVELQSADSRTGFGSENADGSGFTGSMSAVNWEAEFQQRGVRRTIWFTPGVSGQVGFAAFVPTDDVRMSYRFEAVAESREAAMKQVLDQIDQHH